MRLKLTVVKETMCLLSMYRSDPHIGGTVVTNRMTSLRVLEPLLALCSQHHPSVSCWPPCFDPPPKFLQHSSLAW